METKEKTVPRKPRKPASGGEHGTKAKTVERTRRPPRKTAEGKSKTTAKNAAAGKTSQRSSRRQPSPDVVYVQPMPFNRGRFILCIVIAVAVVLAVIFGMAIFFKVDAEKIQVSGTDKYSVTQIVEASGIKDGENLFSVSEPRVSSSIIARLPYVKQVRVGIKLPDTVKIEIEELTVVYSIEDSAGGWWLIRSDGNVIEQTNSADAKRYTKLLGVKLQDPVVGQPAKAFQPVSDTPEGETAPVTVLASEQISVACTVMQYLEDSGIIGELASIDVTNLGDIQLWYGEKYQILLGDSLELSYKIRTLRSSLEQMGDYQSGVLDISFTVWPDKVGYTPFS